MLFNAHYEDIPFSLPVTHDGSPWERLSDTTDPHAAHDEFAGDHPYPLRARSAAVFRLRHSQADQP